MPELPDVTLYVEAIERELEGQRLEKLRISSPFVLRTVDPPPGAFEGARLESVSRIGKRIVLGFDGDLFAVIHLMIAGRLWWRKSGVAVPKGRGLLAFDFDTGSLLFTESAKKKRASIHLASGASNLEAFDRGGLEVIGCGLADFSAVLTRANHTLKRALTDPRVFSGIGNAYSDEILFSAKLSPFKQTQSLTEDEIRQLHAATLEVLGTWTERLRTAQGGKFPEKVTAFHDAMAVHGRYRKPCPVCGSAVQRIVYTERECNYCAKCQTGGRLLADRALSRLLKDNWPRTIDELEG